MSGSKENFNKNIAFYFDLNEMVKQILSNPDYYVFEERKVVLKMIEDF